MKILPSLIAAVLATVCLGLSGCSPLIFDGQSQSSETIELTREFSLGQSFLPQYDGLDGVLLYLEPSSSGDGLITLKLSSDPNQDSNLRVSTISLDNITSPGYYNFRFPPLKESRKIGFYFNLNLKGDGSVKVGTSSGDTYLNGSLYRNNKPRDAQINFKLSHNRRFATQGLLREFAAWGAVIGISIFLFIIPGWSLLSYLWGKWGSIHWAGKLATSAGISLSIYPIILLWTNFFGLQLGSLYAWIPGVIGATTILWRSRNKFKTIPGYFTKTGFRSWFTLHSDLVPDIVLVIILILVIISRFWLVRELFAPLGSDPVHHTMITQLLVEKGGLFDTWEPYNDLRTFTYHFGFHSASAAFQWITGVSSPRSVLWIGQVLNIFAVIAVYPLARRISRNQWAGIFAVLVAGLVSQMPNYFLNWGRYTQLAGMVIMPAAVLLSWDALDEIQFDRKLISLAWIAWGGLAVTHYRVIALGLIIFPAYLLIFTPRKRLINNLKNSFWILIGGGLLVLPWVFQIISGRFPVLLANWLSRPARALSTRAIQFNQIQNLSTYLPVSTWVLLVISWGWAVWNRNRGIITLSLWWFLGLLIANPHWLRLPGYGALSNKIVFLAIYFPGSIIIGTFLGWVISTLQSKNLTSGTSRILCILVVIAVLVLAVWQVNARQSDLHLNEMFVTHSDLIAFDWIKDNLPEDSKFLVNSYDPFGNNWWLGNDAGWWLPLYTSLSSNLPPMIYTYEQGPDPEYSDRIAIIPQTIQAESLISANVLSLLEERGITYVYVGQLRGGNIDGEEMKLLNQLVDNPQFKLVYHQDRVWIFEIIN